MIRALPLLVLIGCGGDTTPATDDAAIDSSGGGSSDASIDASPGMFTLTSPTITEGGTIPLTHVCAGKGGQNESPQLVFTNVPSGTQSFAVVLTDMTNSLVHCAIYDVPGTLTGLPANVDKIYAPTAVPGAHQTLSYQSTVRGYNGPCPPSTHTYQFKVYALGTATLPSATMSTTKEQVVSTAATNLGTATLTATFP
ncbi:MAG TPA: YbhB/YbcL family Raf kinase inhibitor-like protein [Kofleriaceae bacterium]|nr:YbhB/YbcL family Raf kinase inhibitor-like protein [Kofleriaceae bacterium]